MNEKNRFSEHYRIDQYLKKRNTIKVLKSHTIAKSSNQLSNFPIGLIIIKNEDLKYEDKIEFINLYIIIIKKILYVYLLTIQRSINMHANYSKLKKM